MQKKTTLAEEILYSKYLWWGIVLVGAFARIKRYLLNRSLWQDEASLAMNLVTRSFGELTQLLDYHQAAPIGFLFVEKVFVVVFGNHDFIMRFFPLIAGISAVCFISRFARENLGMAGLFATVALAISWIPIHYSSELKQYSSDIAVGMVLIFFAGNALRDNHTRKDFLLLGGVGAALIWISHPSIFVLAGIGLTLFIEKITKKSDVPWRWVFAVGTAWLFSFGVEYLVSLRHIVSDGYMIEYWQKAYIPSPPWTNKKWYIKTYYYFIDQMLHRPTDAMAYSIFTLVILGAFSAMAHKRKIALLLISPFVMVFVASALHRYPLKDRFTLFLVPFALLLMAEGFQGVYWLFSRWNRGFSAILTSALALLVLWQAMISTYPRLMSTTRVDVRPVVAYIAENKQPDDVIYVFFRSGSVIDYYAPLYGLDPSEMIFGVPAEIKELSLRNYWQDVDNLVGRERVWFVFTEVADCPNCPAEDTQIYYREYIEKYGVLVDSVGGSGSNGANAYLYDMNP